MYLDPSPKTYIARQRVLANGRVVEETRGEMRDETRPRNIPKKAGVSAVATEDHAEDGPCEQAARSRPRGLGRGPALTPRGACLDL